MHAVYIQRELRYRKTAGLVLKGLKNAIGGERVPILEIVCSHGQTFASDPATAVEDFAAVFCLHSFAKATCRLPFSFAGLIGALHCSTLFSLSAKNITDFLKRSNFKKLFNKNRKEEIVVVS